MGSENSFFKRRFLKYPLLIFLPFLLLYQLSNYQPNLSLYQAEPVGYTDEFIELVLREVPLEEVQIYLDLNKWAEFDSEIAADLAKVVPGLGEDGKEIKLADHFDNKTILEMEKAIKSDGFNSILGEMISPKRSLPLTRHSGCGNVQYSQDLPTFSIIIVCHNEWISNIARTLHSYIERSPSKLLREIIIVDDVSSNQEMINGKLERYLITQFPKGLIRLIRLKARAGLIRARMIGAYFARGEVIYLSDSHMEAEVGWAEPLLQRIKEDRTRVVWPQLTYVRPRDFRYKSPGWTITGFEWRVKPFFFNWMDAPKRIKRTNSWDPIPSPTMTGGAFAMHRKYFWEIGSYDPGMMIWGAENIELPIRAWMCGGSVEVVPCSRVGHLYRDRIYKISFSSGNSTYEHGDVLTYNAARFAKVWMDEYQKLIFRNIRGWESKDIGNLTGRIELRKRLDCKSFKWFMDNIYPERFQFEFESKASGQYKSMMKRENCLADRKGSKIRVMEHLPCNKKGQAQESQIVSLSFNDTLRIGENGCLEKEKSSSEVLIKSCAKSSEREHWSYNSTSNQIINLDSKECLTLMGNSTRLKLLKCDANEAQKWEFIPV